jgi:D-alanyl-D-alanine carboxypeptidase
MNQAFESQNINRKLIVASGYRSPAYQIVTLIFWFRQHGFDLARTMKQVAMPEYSQHCSAIHTALDIMNINGEPTDENPMDFKRSIEYAWLKNNAAKYNFIESYPPRSRLGIQWEPWHWQYIGIE